MGVDRVRRCSTATRTKLQGIDADAHVIETERTWDYLEPAEQRFRAVLVPAPYDPTRQLWAVEGRAGGFRFPDMSQEQLREISQRARRNMETPQASRELEDVPLRLKHMDKLGIDVQVLHNTLWIEQVTPASWRWRRRCSCGQALVSPPAPESRFASPRAIPQLTSPRRS